MDLENALQDKEVVLENLKKFSFTEEEIIVLEDPSYNDVNILIREVALRTAKA